jgi:hypothetical protein
MFLPVARVWSVDITLGTLLLALSEYRGNLENCEIQRLMNANKTNRLTKELEMRRVG